MDTSTPEPTSEPVAVTPKKNFKLSLDLRLIVVLLLAVIAGMLVLWKPWDRSTTSTRAVEVTGTAKLTAKPDEFVFYPSYDFKGTDKAAELAALTKKSNTIVAKLKSLGVDDSKIKNDSSGYDYPVYSTTDPKQATYTLRLTVTVNDYTLAQKVQDYLVTTTPNGAVTPQANFSEAKRKELESQARDEATKDARAKADQMAKNLGFKIGKVKSVADSSGFGIMPLESSGAVTQDTAKTSSLTLQPGENDLNYSVTVDYFIH